VRHLRGIGMRADYLAIGASPHWDLADYNLIPSALSWHRRRRLQSEEHSVVL